MQDFLRLLVQLQQIDTRILEKRRFIDKVPLRVHEVDEPLRVAKAELEKIRQQIEAILKKKKEKERILEEVQDRIKKMKARSADLKTNKEYQAHLKEIESSEKEIAGSEDELLRIMVEVDSLAKEKTTREQSVKAEEEKILTFKKGLDADVARLQQELLQLKAERENIVSLLDPDIYNTYLTLLQRGGGVALARAADEICLGCDMNIPPQMFLQVRKNAELLQCPQCHRIMYYSEDSDTTG